jgi:hypothetical protein
MAPVESSRTFGAVRLRKDTWSAYLVGILAAGAVGGPFEESYLRRGEEA